MNINKPSMVLKEIDCPNGISIGVFYKSELICCYNFLSIKAPHPIGRELVLATLTSWATIDLCFTGSLEISYSVSRASYDYIVNHFNYIMPTYEKVHQKCRSLLTFSNNVYDLVPLEQNFLCKDTYLLGFTGGKDSTLCRIILERAEKKVAHYYVSYDTDVHAPDGHIEVVVHNYALYEQFSLTEQKKRSEVVSFHQADDIHVTFAAPYYDLPLSTPSNLVVGLPWDVIHCFEGGYTDLVPTESYGSICILTSLFAQLGLSDFRIISPIAVLHSLGVYQAVNQVIGFNNLLKLDSCWNSYLFGGEQCGTCPKCQRLKVIYKHSFQYEYLNWIPDIFFENTDFLFGSIYATESLNKHSHIKWDKSLLLDDISISFADEFVPILYDLLNFELKDVSNLQIDFNLGSQLWSEITKQIIMQLHINYKELTDEPVSELVVPWMPFEEEYNWHRNNKILNCFGIIPIYNKSEWEELVIKKEGPRLVLPDTEIFRRWLNIDIIKVHFPELLTYVISPNKSEEKRVEIAE